MALFRDRGVQMVDTTCPWVAKVWNSVDQYGRKQYTSEFAFVVFVCLFFLVGWLLLFGELACF